ncbi:DUF6603 domain-containing protein [Paenibacillus terreus]|uniref:DUF6603 domain-containing protein n=1 Tax=Paenibacillus terreus TaxID=1387834 RepID=A0ABV5BEN1_9BACL
MPVDDGLLQNVLHRLRILDSNIPLNVPTEFYELNLNNICKNTDVDLPDELIMTADISEYSNENPCKIVLFAKRVSSAPVEYLFAFSIKLERIFSLSDIEIFGKSYKELGFINLKIDELIFASDKDNKITRETIRDWNARIVSELGEEQYKFPEVDLDYGLRLMGLFQIGDYLQSISQFLGFRDSTFVNLPLNSLTDTDYRLEVWYPAQYTFGPLTLSRVGLSYDTQAKRFQFLIEAVLSVSNVKLVLTDLKVTSPFKQWIPTTWLDSLALSYDMPDILEISGGLLRDNHEYSGIAVVELIQRTLVAIGSYAERDGTESLFIFASVKELLGGPPYLYVTGLGFGFGVNKQFIEPPIDKVREFPLLQSPCNDIEQVLASLEGSWIQNNVGSNWLALGIDFLTFQFIESHALLIAQFKHDFEMLILGFSELKIPRENPYVYIELQYKGSWKPNKGFVGITAQITSNSYLFDPDCKLTGDFAFWSWYKGSQQGDFILSAGGYHPQFVVPSHYPTLERVSVNWPIQGGTIKGQSYFALTPSCLMGGGNLELTYGGNNASISLTAYAHVLVEWEPFHFDVAIGVTIKGRARIKMKYVGNVSASFEIGANLELWGTPTGGKVSFGYKSLRLTVGFGKERSGASNVSSPEKLREALPGGERYLQAQVKKGLIREHAGEWIIRPDDFAFTIESGIPITSYDCFDAVHDTKLPKLHIRPLPCGSSCPGTYRSHLYVRVQSSGSTWDDKEWEVKELEMYVPEALWGEPVASLRPSSKLTQQTVGLAFRPVVPAIQPEGSIDLHGKIGIECLPEKPTVTNINIRHMPGEPSDILSDRLKILSHINDNPAKSERQRIIHVLTQAGIYNGSNDSLLLLSRDAAQLYPEPPLIMT